MFRIFMTICMKSCVKLSANFFIRRCYQRKKRGILKGIWKLTPKVLFRKRQIFET